MKEDTTNNFAPELRIYEFDSGTAVIFDSLSPTDEARAARTIYSPKRLKQLDFRLEGFDEQNMVDFGDHRTITGKIILVFTDDAGVTDYELAAPVFVLGATGKAKKNGVHTFEAVDAAEYNVRQGVSDALIGAMSDYFAAASGLGAAAPYAPYPMMAPVGAPTQGAAVVGVRTRGMAAANDEKRSYRRKMAGIIVGTSLLIWVVAWGGSRLLRPVNPIEDAVARAMQRDPSSVQAQVELTKQTLQQMGLDPGKGGDIGCLTKP